MPIAPLAPLAKDQEAAWRAPGDATKLVRLAGQDVELNEGPGWLGITGPEDAVGKRILPRSKTGALAVPLIAHLPPRPHIL